MRKNERKKERTIYHNFLLFIYSLIAVDSLVSLKARLAKKTLKKKKEKKIAAVNKSFNKRKDQLMKRAAMKKLYMNISWFIQ